MFITELIDREIIQLEHIASAKNIADILTKPLSKVVFQGLRNTLLNITDVINNMVYANERI